MKPLRILLLLAALAASPNAIAGTRYQRGGQDTDVQWLVVASDFIGPHRGGHGVELCDGTDDQVQIQAAIDAAAASGRNGAIVKLSPGLFTVSKSAAAVDIVFVADLTDGVGEATLTNPTFSVGEAGDMAAGQLFRVSGGQDDDGGLESVEDNHSDCIVTIKSVAGGPTYVIGEDFNAHNYTQAGAGTRPTFVRLQGAIQLKGQVMLRGSGLGGVTRIYLDDDQNIPVITKDDATPAARTIGGGIEYIDIQGNRDNQGDHNNATYHPMCMGVGLNDDTWDFLINQAAIWKCKGDGVWFCNSWGQHVNGGWIEYCSGSGLVFGNGTVARVDGTKIADVGDATNRDAHASNLCPGDGAVFKVAGIRLHWTQRCIIQPALVECNQHWGLYGLQAHNNIISGAVFEVTNAGAAAEGSIWLHASTKGTITGNHFDLNQAGATGIKPGGYSFTITGNHFLDIGGTTPIDWSSASGMNVCNSNVNDSPYAVSIADAGTLTVRSTLIHLTCTTGGGGTIGLAETSPVHQVPVTIINVGANNATFTNQAGVKELNGNWVGAQWDALTVVYVTDRWVEISRK